MIVELFRRMHTTAMFAEATVLETLAPGDTEAVKLMSHILGARLVWITRLEGGDAKSINPFAEWPLEECRRAHPEIRRRWLALLDRIDDADTAKPLIYTTRDGKAFEVDVADVLTHMVTHTYHHAGQINRLVRQAGRDPASIDYVGFHRQELLAGDLG